MTEKKKKWLGDIDTCNICQEPVGDIFIDGATKMGPWACMCPTCFEAYGVGLGLGRGQKYRLDPVLDQYYKIEG